MHQFYKLLNPDTIASPLHSVNDKSFVFGVFNFMDIKHDYVSYNSNKSLNDIEGEIWADVQGYEGVYKVSTFGRIKRLETSHMAFNRWGKTMRREIRGRIHKYHLDKSARPRIQLSKDGINKIFSVSRLVAVAFVPNPYNLPNVCHHDDIPVNNVYLNLFWGTTQDNIDDKCKKNRQAKGEKNGRVYLKGVQVIEIRKKYNRDTYGLSRLANEYGTTATNISYIVTRKNWKHI